MTHQPPPIRSLADLGRQWKERQPLLPLGGPGQVDLSFIREGLVTFSARQMQIVLDRCSFPGEREIDFKYHVPVLQDLMEHGRWLPKDQLAFCLLDGHPYLVNGYHRAFAQIASGMTIPWDIVFYPVRSMEEVRAIYLRFDTNTKKRSAAELLDAAQYAETHGLRKQVAAGLYGAIPIITAGFPSSIREMDVMVTRSIDRRLGLAEDYLPAARLFQQCVEGGQQRVFKKLLRATTMAVALATLRYQPEIAKAFWTGVAANDGLDRGDPRQALFLHFVEGARQRHGGTIGQLLGPPALCWNAYYEGRNLAYARVPHEWSVHITGTPWEYVRPRDKLQQAEE